MAVSVRGRKQRLLTVSPATWQVVARQKQQEVLGSRPRKAGRLRASNRMLMLVALAEEASRWLGVFLPGMTIGIEHL